MDPFTAALHGDDGIDDAPGLGPPIHVATTYDRTRQDALVYRRSHHQTTDRLEAVIGALEGGHAVAYPSGMAAVAALLRHLRPRRVSLPDDVYHGTRTFVVAEAERGAWEIDSSLDAGDVRWIETPSNPRCLITDIAAAAGEAAVVVVDSTFATPVLQQPLRLGADFVVHSTTKFIGGHSDAMGGVIITGDGAAAQELRDARVRDGSIPGSLDAWLTLRGVRTLPLRIERQSAGAGAVAEHLAGKVATVWYPFLPGHPGGEVARRQMSAGGGVLSFELPSERRAREVLSRLRLFRMATSLGGVESLVEHRRSVNPLAPAGLLRLSVGLEAPEDLIADLDRALG